jgi:hypothetical protein
VDAIGSCVLGLLAFLLGALARFVDAAAHNLGRGAAVQVGSDVLLLFIIGTLVALMGIWWGSGADPESRLARWVARAGLLINWLTLLAYAFVWVLLTGR